MNCPNCGNCITQNDKFCRACGYNLQNMNYNNNQNNYYCNDTHINQNNYSYNYSYSNSKDLKEVYIGNNYETIQKGGFSFWAFFFGAYYLLYRKMWLYGIAWFILSIIMAIFVPNFSYILSIGLGILFGIKFNCLYMKQVEENVDKIKQENLGKSNQELEAICHKKGGVSILAVVLSIVIIIIGSICVSIYVFVNQNIDTNINTTVTDTITSDNKISNLSYNMPSTFESSKYDTNTYKYYSNNASYDNCTITIQTYSLSSYYSSAEEYLRKSVYTSESDIVSDITTTKIKNVDWKIKSVESHYSKSYNYASTNNDKLYVIKYSVYNDKSQTCSAGFQSFTDSLKFN